MRNDLDLAAWLPTWIRTLGTAVWVSDPQGRIAFMNERAEPLLGRNAADCLGEPCHSVMRGTGKNGESICNGSCAVRRLAASQRPVEPVEMRMPGAGGRWVQVLVIALSAPDGTHPWLVHCAQDVDLARRSEGYLERIASRSAPDESIPARLASLTPREEEVLALLARDQDARAIAAGLFVSYTTVRNHVQNVLRKLEVHSIEEAVALHLLHGGI